MNERQSKQTAEDVVHGIQQDFKIVGSRRVHSWYAWAVVGIVFGMALGVVYVANNSGAFVASKAAEVKVTVLGPADMAAGLVYTVGMRPIDSAFIADARAYMARPGQTIVVSPQLGTTFGNTNVAAGRYNLDGPSAVLSAVFTDGKNIWLGTRSGQTITINTTLKPLINGDKQINLHFKGVYLNAKGQKQTGEISGLLYAGIDVGGKYAMTDTTRARETNENRFSGPDVAFVTPPGMPLYAITPIKITSDASGKVIGSDNTLLLPSQQRSGTWTLYYRDRDVAGTTDGNLEIYKKDFEPVPNQAPVLGAIANQAVVAGQPLTFTLVASDADGDPVTFSSATLPAGASLNAQTGVFTWAPSPTTTGYSKAIAFKVSDDQKGSSEKIVTVAVARTPVVVTPPTPPVPPISPVPPTPDIIIIPEPNGNVVDRLRSGSDSLYTSSIRNVSNTDITVVGLNLALNGDALGNVPGTVPAGDRQIAVSLRSTETGAYWGESQAKKCTVLYRPDNIFCTADFQTKVVIKAGETAYFTVRADSSEFANLEASSNHPGARLDGKVYVNYIRSDMPQAPGTISLPASGYLPTLFYAPVR